MVRTKVLKRIRTERKTTNPVNITFAGGNACKVCMRVRILNKLTYWGYQADTSSHGLREGMKNLHSWIQPFDKLSIAALRLIELLYLLLKHFENATRRIAGLELVGEWVLDKILLCALFVRF